MTEVPPDLTTPFVDLLLALADDKLMLGHRNSDWTGLAPILEEDIAFSSLAQDEIAHASAIYELLAPIVSRSADALAFGRAPEAYRCAAIVTLPDEFDWATALCRQLFCDHFDRLRLARLARSSHEQLAALARRMEAEERVHVEHGDEWMQRLGRGTSESRARMQAALDALGPPAVMLFEPVEGQPLLEEAGLYPLAADPPDMFAQWAGGLTEIVDAAGLKVQLEPPAADAVDGRRGRPSEHLAALLEEMCEVFRLEPDAAW